MAKIKESIGNNHHRLEYVTPVVQDVESALKWIIRIYEKKAFSLKTISLYDTDDVYTESISRLFNKDEFVEKYSKKNIQNISVHCSFHQYDVVFHITLSNNVVELMFDKNSAVDYSSIEDCLKLNK